MKEATKGLLGMSRCTKTSCQNRAGREVKTSGGGIGRNRTTKFSRKAFGQEFHGIRRAGGEITSGVVPGKGPGLAVSTMQSVRSRERGGSLSHGTNTSAPPRRKFIN